MDGPWTQYAPPSAAVAPASGPWAQYAPPNTANAADGDKSAPLPAYTEYGPIATTPSAPAQSQAGADINAVAQGATSGVGGVIAGAGRLAQAGTGPSAQRVLASLDLVDQGQARDAYQGLTDTERQQVAAYRGADSANKQDQRAALQQAIDDYSQPNAVTRAGESVQQFGQEAFPVMPEHEGFQTGVGRMIGGVAPALAATAVGGPLAGAAAISSQAYDQTYKDAIAKGATPEIAENAAGKSAVAQALTMALPVGRLLTIPASVRDGLAKTLVNLGQNGIEFGSANAVSTFANNYVAQQTYDPTRSLTQGVGEAGLEGAVTGLVVPALGVAVRSGQQATPADIIKAPNVDSAINAAQSFISQDAAKDIGTSWESLFSAKAPAGEVADTGPASAGAAASRENTPQTVIDAQTPAQKATALQKMVNQSAEDRLTPQGRDDAVYVPGVERPEAMRDFTPAQDGAASAALAHKTLYNTDANYHDQFDAIVKNNNNIMVDKLNDIFGDANSRDVAMNEAKQLMPGAVGLFDDQHPVDAQPVVDKINEILASAAGKRGSVESQLNSILPKLYDTDGNLETMPSMLKGVRDDITDRLYDKSPTTEGNAARTARNQLQDVLSVIDSTIASGLPGTKYQDYLTNLSAALGQVSKLDYLQKFLTGPGKLTDLAGNLQFNKVQKMLQDIQAHQADRTGGAKELSTDEINQIEAVRNELAAKDLLDRRASVRGSPTAQITNAAGMFGSGPLGAGVKGAGEVALHLGLAKTTLGLGNVVLGGYRYVVKPALEAARAKQAAAELAATKERLLDTTPNPPQ